MTKSADTQDLLEEGILDKITKAQNERDLEKSRGVSSPLIDALQSHIDNLYADYYQLTRDN